MKCFTRALASTLLVTASIASLATTAQAHGIWFAQRAQQLALIYGIGADDLDMVRRLPLINAVLAYDADWNPVEVALEASGPIPLVRAEAPYAVVATRMDYGLWTKTADGRWFNRGRDETPDAILAEHTFKYAVHLGRPVNAPVPLIPGHRLQIVPASADIPQDIGAPFTVRVYFDGQPMAGVQIKTDFVNDPDQPPMMTGPDGAATFRLRNQGLNVIAAIADVESPEPEKADHHEHLATLTFVLPHEEE